jgi:hypothetical protein
VSASVEAALRALGVQCTVETRGNLAVVIPVPGERGLEDAAVRRAVVAELRARGYTHAAVEASEERAQSLDPNAAQA